MTRPRRRPHRPPGTLAYLLVLAVGLAGVAVVAADAWWQGTLALGGAMVVAGWVRLGFPERWAGLLGVRTRLFDALVLNVLGVALIALVVSILERQHR